MSRSAMISGLVCMFCRVLAGSGRRLSGTSRYRKVSNNFRTLLSGGNSASSHCLVSQYLRPIKTTAADFRSAAVATQLNVLIMKNGLPASVLPTIPGICLYNATPSGDIVTERTIKIAPEGVWDGNLLKSTARGAEKIAYRQLFLSLTRNLTREA